jgi:uncharacterized membrane protein (DUF485 family)
MKLDQIVLIIVIVFVIAWVGTAVAGAFSAGPWGVLVLIPLAIVGGLVIAVIVQRMRNKEDDYYEKNVDK